jgi:hypothetical protein
MEVGNKQNEIKPIENQTETHVPVVETLAGDMADVIGSGTGTSVKDIIRGAEENDAEKKRLSPKSKENKIFTITGVLFLVLAFATVAFLFYRKNSGTVVIEKQFTPIVFTDQSVPLEISGFKKDEIEQAVLGEINTAKMKTGGVEGIYLTENGQMIGLRKFISLINSHFTPSDNPIFVNDNFLVGFVKNQTSIPATPSTGFFILIKVRSATDIFDSLRTWEPNILTDLHGFLGTKIGSDTSYLFTKDFTDSIIENKNARVLYDKDGNIVVMYIFADDNSVIITDSENAANIVMQRLASGQVEQ